MVLADLGASLNAALRKLGRASAVDETALNECLREVVTALLAADVNVRLVSDLRARIRTSFIAEQEKCGPDKSRLVFRLVAAELTRMLTAERQRPTLRRGRSNVMMFVGLQGSGKTTTCTKIAFHYKRKGWRVALVCADTFRAGAFDQLKQNATRVGIPFFGSYSEADPCKIAAEGVARFRAEKFELIVVDTSGRHKQEAALFEEMREIHAAVQPDEVLFTMDSHIGQACADQAAAFASAVNVGSVVVTKLDGHAKGGGALSAVAATGAPLAFLGTGEHFDQLEVFNAEGFVSRLLGMGDLKGLMETVAHAMPMDKQPEMLDRLVSGRFTLRDMRDQVQTVMNMGPMSQLMSMLPGVGNAAAEMLGGEKGEMATKRLKKFIVIMDSLTPAELDNKKPITDRRLVKIARGSGTSVAMVKSMLEQHKQMSKMVGNMGKALGGGKRPDLGKLMRNPQAAMQNMSKMMNPQAMAAMQKMMASGGPAGGFPGGGIPGFPF